MTFSHIVRGNLNAVKRLGETNQDALSEVPFKCGMFHTLMQQPEGFFSGAAIHHVRLTQRIKI